MLGRAGVERRCGVKLGVNVDHVATLREARLTFFPDPVVAAMLCEYAGANSIVVHLREDRRHIKERDVILIKKAVKIPLNLEMSANKEIVDFACKIVPNKATLVPEKRQELTTEGGLNLIKNYDKVKEAVRRLNDKNIEVSLFVDPSNRQIEKAKKIGVSNVEINTGRYSQVKTLREKFKELKKIEEAAILASGANLFVAAGHGLDYGNVKEIAKIKRIKELNIGHSIISRSVFAGIVSAVEEMLQLIIRR